jgi:hypothetical protein
MDLSAFLDFLLAWEHHSTPQGLRYFWAVLDIRRQAYLDMVGRHHTGCTGSLEFSIWARDEAACCVMHALCPSR